MVTGTAGMRAVWAIGVVFAAAVLSACAAPEPPPINSSEFARRSPPPGQPSYFETIKYVDNGAKYVDPSAEFFISYDGEMCFRGLVNRQSALFETYRTYWCMSPLGVNNIEALNDDVSYVNSIRLWCGLATPQCAHRLGLPDFLDTSSGIANSISAQLVPYRQQRGALEYLVYLMGGNTRDSPPTAGGRFSSLR
jgi:hypothetical protein